jgi:signal transduction histidine kinase
MAADVLPGPRRPAFRLGLGLRGRVTAALILASALTLAVTALALLTPMQWRLRDDAVNGLAETTLPAALLTDRFVARRRVRRLNALRDAVTAADAAGGRFVATASHELRTPLASLRLMLGMLEEDLDAEAPDLAGARHQVARATAQAERLSRLAGDLLDLSRLDAAVPLRDEPVDLRAIARAVAAEFEDVRGVAVVLEPEERSAGWALGDPGAVAQILRILLDNALRFAPAGTPVTVALRREGRRCVAGVRDEGPGVAPGDRERIFERFERGATARGGREASSGGFGLGLAIGRELARRMGGDIRLSSPATPTCFTLELPIAGGEPPVPEPAPLPSARGVRVA